MVINGSELKNVIKERLKELNPHLSLRIQLLLNEFLSEELDSDEIDLFTLLVRLILRADSDPASSIANLMVPLDTEGSYQLDEHTISSAAAFLRDYLKKDDILHILKNDEDKTQKKG